MAAPTPVESASALLSTIERSNLLSAESLAKTRETASALSDPKAIARALIKDGTLTRWQADQLLHGYHLLVVGKYKLLDQIETSPTGRVYLAEHVQMGRRHSLKILAKRLATNPDAVARFLKGAQNACGLDHKNISHVYDVSQDKLGHYVVMEYVEGQSLEQLVEKSGPLKLTQALDTIAQVAEGLVYAHSHGVVHGDLKPANLVRDNSGVIKILEIGQDGAGARPETDDADEDVETASLAAVIFQAPELRGDGEGADIACDVYSLGSVLAFLLTGKAAKNAATAAGQMESIQEIPGEVVALCRSLMADSPAERPRSIDQVLDSVYAIAKLSTDSTQPAPADEPENISKKKRDKKSSAVVVEVASAAAPPVAVGSGGGLPAIAVDGRTLSIPVPPPANFSIQTRGRLRKKAVASGAGDSTAANRWSIAALTNRFSPLVIAGAIGGAAVFAFGVGTILVLLIANRASKPIAKANDSKTQIAQQAAAEAPAGDAEANPMVVATDVNPELAAVAAAAPADVNPPVVATPAEPSASPPPQPPVATAATTPPVTAAPPPATPPVATPPVEAKAESTEAPAAVVAAAPVKPTAPASAMPKKAAGDPFKGFAKAISLPPLPDPDSPVAAPLKPVSLGACDADATMPITLGLLGGDSAIRTGRQKFELQPGADNPREWEIKLTGMSEPAIIAVLSVKEGELLFQWTEEAAKQSLVARNLMNCALALGKSKQTVGLRTAVKGQPLLFDIEKPSAAMKWNVANLPAAKQIFLEVTKTEGFAKIRQDPKGPTNAGDLVTIGSGSSDKSVPLWLKLNTAAAAATIDVRVQAAVKVEGWTDPRPYRRKDLIAMQAQHQMELGRVRSELRKAKDSRPTRDEEKLAREATITRLAREETAHNTILDQLRYVLDFASVTEGAAKIHFRVYCVAGDAKIDLLRTDEEEEASK